MQKLYRRNSGNRGLDRPMDSFPFGTGDECPKRSFWEWEMKLSHLIFFHHAIFGGAILAAVFMGMVLQYNIQQAEQRGMIKVYVTMPIEALAKIEI